MVIMIKFLIVKNKSEQKSMIVFYVISITDLMSRVLFLVLSCFFEQFNSALSVIQTVSTFLSISSGVAHSNNLSNLLLDF